MLPVREENDERDRSDGRHVGGCSDFRARPIARPSYRPPLPGPRGPVVRGGFRSRLPLRDSPGLTPGSPLQRAEGAKTSSPTTARTDSIHDYRLGLGQVKPAVCTVFLRSDSETQQNGAGFLALVTQGSQRVQRVLARGTQPLQYGSGRPEMGTGLSEPARRWTSFSMSASRMSR